MTRCRFLICSLLALAAASVLPSRALAVLAIPGVPETDGYRVVYQLDIPDNSGGWAQTPANLLAAYSINNSSTGTGTVADNSFTRVGYYLELGGSGNVNAPNGFVYASFEAAGFTSETAKLGVPNTYKFQQTVNNMNVVSNYPGIVTGNGITTGNIEFWPSNYNQNNDIGIPGASSTANNPGFDFGDGGSNTGVGHGSFQIHNYGAAGGGQTLFGYSAWGTVRDSELGIGNNPNAVASNQGRDWTFATNNNDNYTVQRLIVVVNDTPPPPPVANAPPAPQNLVNLCPELANYQLVYQKALPNSANLNANGAAYDVDNTGLVQSGSFNRVAYLLELAGSTNPNSPNGYVCVSFDSAGFTNDATKIGIPTTGSGEFYQQYINNMKVMSDVSGVITGEFTQGNIEFWPSNYNQSNPLGVPGASTTANNTGYDFGDGNAGTGAGFGSMQIHNFMELQTILAYNSWGNGQTSNLGIGNNPVNGAAPDWTFQATANLYTTKNLYVLILPNQIETPAPEPASLSLLALAGAALLRRRKVMRN